MSSLAEREGGSADSGYKQALIDAMDQAGITDPDERAAIAAIAGGECALRPRSEIGYARTSNDRIRRIFSKTRQLDDDELNALKTNDVDFFNFVYGGKYGNRPGTDDGYTYRGRGPFQLTVVAYVSDRYDGSGWEAMKACVGFNTPDISARKDLLYQQICATREFASKSDPAGASA